MTYIRGLAVPYGVRTLVADRGPGGQIQLFTERFDSHSWAALPSRVPFTRTHSEESPLGWAQIRSTPKGLMIQATLIDSTIAADSLSAMRAKLLRGLSIGFTEDAERDEWKRGGDGKPPSVLRRGSTLRHVALVSSPAYDGAQVTELAEDSFAHSESEAWMKPYREQRARAAAKRKAESDRVLAETMRVLRSGPLDLRGLPIELRGPQAGDNAGGDPTMPGAVAPTAEARVVDLGGGTQLTVMTADAYEAEHLAESYRSAVVQGIRAQGRALTSAELDEIRQQHRVLV